KWGWVIYRTSYKNEAAWDRFRDDITRRPREELEESAASPFVRGAADWTFVSDPALEGASHDELRARFRAWRARAYYAETRRGVPQTGADITSRYLCFVEVDEAALDSVSRASEPGGGPAVVNFIECDRDAAFAFDTVPELDKWEGGDGYWEWRMLAERISCLGFWQTYPTR
ncbi:twin arginine translocation protein, partial [Staphylotrichum tortipilum]